MSFRSLFYWGIAWFTAFVAGVNVGGESGSQCEICGDKNASQYYLMQDAVRSRRVVVCPRCSQLKEVCLMCRLPVLKGFTTLSDGRFLCELDAPNAVLTAEVAEAIFRDAQRDIFAMLSGLGVLPDRNITVQLVSQKELARIYYTTPGNHQDTSLQGVTRSKRYGKDSFEHQIYLCEGLSRSRMAAVSAHEYAHTWIHENVPNDRGLDPDTVEAFCELTAYQLMQQRGEAQETKMILENAYTRGKIDVLVKVSGDYQFHRVAEWMKSGKDETLDRQKAERVMALKEGPTTLFGYLPVVHARAPETLSLKGLGGRMPNRFALVNEATLQAGEEAVLRLAEKTVRVRCLEVGEDFVSLQLEGGTNTVRLQMQRARPQ